MTLKVVTGLRVFLFWLAGIDFPILECDKLNCLLHFFFSKTGVDQRHEDVVRDSLLSALDATLTQLPSFQEESSSTGVSTYSQPMPAVPDLGKYQKSVH